VTSSAKPAEPKISDEDRQRAVKLLDVSEAQSRSFEAPLRSYMLYQIAQSFLPLEKSKSRTLFRDAFISTLEIRDDADTKERLQNAILLGLLNVSQSDVEELLPQAEPAARTKASTAIAKRYLDAKKYDRAVEMVESITRVSEFPYDVGTQIMAALPENMSGQFRSLFTQAQTSFTNTPHKGVSVGGGSFPNMLLRFGARLPQAQTLDAIEEILKQAKAQDSASISLSAEGGTASFGSYYDYQLFQLLPLLKKYDEGRANALLRDNAAVKSASQQYPKGLESLDPNSPDYSGAKPAAPDGAKEDKPRSGGMSISVNTGNSGRTPSSDEYARMETMRRAQQVARDSEKNPLQAIAQAMSLPSEAGFSPRAQALQGIATANVKKDPTAAKQALDELRKTVSTLVPQNQTSYLRTASNLYLELEDSDAAQSVLNDGFKLSEKMLASDTDGDDPNKALKAYWPSVESYRQFLEIETKISQRDALAKLDEIQDPEMQTIERVMFTNVLLGKPMKSSIVSIKKKNTNSMRISNSD
jgi:hypothetical protein